MSPASIVEGALRRPGSIDSVTRRLVYSLALLPIVPAVAFAGVWVFDYVDDIGFFHLTFSVIWVAATILIWRGIILWTLGRRCLTYLVTMIPFVQVVYAQPLWYSGGCLADMYDNALRTGQHQVSIAVWVWLSIWVWWGWEKRVMARAQNVETSRQVRFSPAARRFAASLGTIPAIFGVWLIVGTALDTLSASNADPFLPAMAVTAAFAATLWILIWRRAVRWSLPAIGRTLLAATVFLAVPLAAAILNSLYSTTATTGSNFVYAILAMLPIIGWGVWMAVTITIWSPRAGMYSGAVEGPRCLKCSYLLTGLRSTRCPECGDEPTLDELWQASAAGL